MNSVESTRVAGRDITNPSVAWFIGPAVALIYPYLLIWFNSNAVLVGEGAGPGRWLLAGAILLTAILSPLVGLWAAVDLGRVANPSSAEKLARRTALVSVAVSPIYVLAGVFFLMAGKPSWDLPFVSIAWVMLSVLIAVASRHRTAPKPVRQVKVDIRKWHGIAAAAAVVYLLFHFSNHLVGLIGPDAHQAVMDVFRTVYRSSVVEPLLTLIFLFLIASGTLMAWRLTARPATAVRTFQIAGGVFLIFAVASHINAVLYLARVYFNIESDWGFAVGAPDGLLKNAWNIRLLPYYYLAVFFVISHAFCGLRGVMLAHGVPTRSADRALNGGIALAFLISTLIILAMAGMRLSFDL